MKYVASILLYILFVTSPYAVWAGSYNVELVGRDSLGPAADIYVVDKHAYLCAGGMVIILDVRDPVNPVEVSRIHTPGMALAVYVFDGFAYVADGREGLRVVNVSDLENPQEVGYYDTPGSAVDVYIVKNKPYRRIYAYVADGGLLRVLDVSDPGNPVASYDTAYGADQVHATGQYAYVSSGGLRIVRTRYSEKPYEVGFYNTPERARGVYVDGEYAYVCDGGADDAGEGVGLHVIGISNPETPREVGFLENGATTVYISQGYAYLGQGNGVLVVDISDPRNPRRVGHCNTPGGAVAVFASGDYIYAATVGTGHAGRDGGLSIIDVSDPGNPHEVGAYQTRGWANSIHVVGDYAYIAAGSSGGEELPTPSGALSVVDVSDPRKPLQIGFHDTPGWAAGVYVAKGYAYLAGGLGHVDRTGRDFRVIDISMPEKPQDVWWQRYSYPVSGVYGTEDYLYMTDWEGIHIMDISEAGSPNEVGFYKIDRVEGIHVVGDYAYVASRSKGFHVIDVSNSEEPLKVSSWVTGRDEYDVHVAGDYAYIADQEGLRIMDVSHPESLDEATLYSVQRGTRRVYRIGSVYVADGYAYVADGDGFRVHVLDVSDPANPQEVGFYDTPGEARDIHVTDGYIYVADGAGGMCILRYTGGSSEK